MTAAQSIRALLELERHPLATNHQLANTLRNAISDIEKLLKAAKEMREALQECEPYFDNRADAEYDTSRPEPIGNEEMSLLVQVRNALGATAWLEDVGGDAD